MYPDPTYLPVPSLLSFAMQPPPKTKQNLKEKVTPKQNKTKKGEESHCGSCSIAHFAAQFIL